MLRCPSPLFDIRCDANVGNRFQQPSHALTRDAVCPNALGEAKQDDGCGKRMQKQRPLPRATGLQSSESAIQTRHPHTPCQ